MVLSKQKNAARTQETAENDPAAFAHVGELLRQERETHGLSLDMVADELMIRRFYLDALEGGSFKDLPERVYATGFVKNYAKYLGMDVAMVAEQFKREAYGSRAANNYQIDLNMPEPVTHSVVPGRSAIFSAVAILAFLIAAFVFFSRTDHKETSTAIPAPEIASTQNETTLPNAVSAPVNNDVAEQGSAESPEPAMFASATPAATTTVNTPAAANAANVAASLPAQTNAAALPAAAAPAPVVIPGQPRRMLEALQNTWTEVRDEKNMTLFKGTLTKGQFLPLPEAKRVTITTGNAGGLRLLQDGEAQAPFGQLNEVKRNIPIAVAPQASNAAAISR